MFGRLYSLNSKIAARGYAVNSAKYLKLQAELGEILQRLREVTEKMKSLKVTRELIQKFGEENHDDKFFINTKKQSLSRFFDKSLEAKKLLYSKNALSLLYEIKQERAPIPVIVPTNFTKK